MALPAGGHIRDQALQPCVGEPEVDVAAFGRRDRGAVRNLDRLRELRRDLRGRLPQFAGELQTGRARVVAMGRVAGAADLEVGHVADAEGACGLLQGRLDARADRVSLGAHPHVGCWAESVSWTCEEAPPRVKVTVTR